MNELLEQIKRFTLQQTLRTYSVFLLSMTMFFWGALFASTTKLLFVSKANKLFVYYMAVLSIVLCGFELMRMQIFEPSISLSCWNVFDYLLLLLFSTRLGLVATRIYMFKGTSSRMLLIWFLILVALEACIIFPEAIELPQRGLFASVKFVFFLMIVKFHSRACSKQSILLRFIMALTLLLPSGIINFIAECEIWFALSTCLGCLVFRNELFQLAGKADHCAPLMSDQIGEKPYMLNILPEIDERSVRSNVIEPSAIRVEDTSDRIEGQVFEKTEYPAGCTENVFLKPASFSLAIPFDSSSLDMNLYPGIPFKQANTESECCPDIKDDELDRLPSVPSLESLLSKFPPTRHPTTNPSKEMILGGEGSEADILKTIPENIGIKGRPGL